MDHPFGSSQFGINFYGLEPRLVVKLIVEKHAKNMPKMMFKMVAIFCREEKHPCLVHKEYVSNVRYYYAKATMMLCNNARSRGS